MAQRTLAHGIVGDAAHDGYALRTVGGIPMWLPVREVPAGGSTGQVLTKASATDWDTLWSTPASGGGGGGTGWTKYLDNALTATTGFTTLTGTWSVSSGQIVQTGTAAQYNRLKYNTAIARALGAIEVEVRYDSGGSGATRACGLLGNHNGVGNSASFSLFLVSNDTGSTWKVEAEGDGFTQLLTVNVTYTPGTWARLSAVYTASGYEIYFNGTYLGLAYNTNTANRVIDGSYVGLMSYAATASYRNLKVWGITPPF